jgi:Domain of unknown function (DUF4160)
MPATATDLLHLREETTTPSQIQRYVTNDRRVPTISAFYGIVIAMYYAEHGRPHFHVRYAEHRASIAIDTLEVLAGGLPEQALRLVSEWATLHRFELAVNWRRARDGAPLAPIHPLY